MCEKYPVFGDVLKNVRFTQKATRPQTALHFAGMLSRGAYSYGVQYDHFPGAYKRGNLIYDINNFLYRGVWVQGLTEFGINNPK